MLKKIRALHLFFGLSWLTWSLFIGGHESRQTTEILNLFSALLPLWLCGAVDTKITFFARLPLQLMAIISGFFLTIFLVALILVPNSSSDEEHSFFEPNLNQSVYFSEKLDHDYKLLRSYIELRKPIGFGLYRSIDLINLSEIVGGPVTIKKNITTSNYEMIGNIKVEFKVERNKLIIIPRQI